MIDFNASWLKIIIIVVLCVLGWLKRRNLSLKVIRAVSNIPGNSVWYLCMNFYIFWGSPEFIWDRLREINRKYLSIFKIWGGNRVLIFLKHPDEVEVLLTSNTNITKSEIYSHLSLWLNTGLLTSTGDKWRHRRKLLTPAFHFNILKQFVPAIEQCSENSVKEIALECNTGALDVVPIVTEHALHALCETTMGISIDSKSQEIKEYKRAIHGFGANLLERLLRPWLWSDYIMMCLEFGRNLNKMIHTLRVFTTGVIQKRLENWDSSQNFDLEKMGKRKLPMLDLLIGQMKNGEKIDYAGICEEVDTFMFEGHDTTSMALTFMLMLLANNPHIQDKILEEQNEIFGDSKRAASFEDIQNMNYLERCIKESLRLYPPVPIIIRALEEDLVLKDYVIPAEIEVFVLIYDLHRNPDVWPDPEKYDPDRFLQENCVGRHPFAYVPFSAGPRNCIGQKFAMMEMKSFVGKIIRNYRLEPIDTPETIQMRVDLVLRPSKSIRVKFQKRF